MSGGDAVRDGDGDAARVDMRGDELRQLVYGLAHDLGAPLRAVTQFGHLLHERCADSLDERERYWLQLVEDNGRRAQDMVAALVDYTRLGKERAAAAPIPVADWYARALHAERAAIAERGASVDLRDDLGALRGSLQLWDRWLRALLGNALRHHRLAADQPLRIEVRCARRDGGCVVSVEDNGAGIAAARRAEALQPFRRLHPSESPGLGMGLACCRRIAELEGGSLSLGESDLGGLAVTFRRSRGGGRRAATEQ